MDEELLHSMTYAERETLKNFARKGENLDQTLIMIAAWMACATDVSISGYAANWAAANKTKSIQAMRAQWPLVGPCHIADNSSEWGSGVKEA